MMGTQIPVISVHEYTGPKLKNNICFAGSVLHRDLGRTLQRD